MTGAGRLEKMLILAFDSAAEAERGGTTEAKERFTALINPETYTLEYRVKTQDAQGHGTSGAQAKYEFTLPEELTFEFLFDSTGLVDGTPRPDGVLADVVALRRMLTEYQPESHEPFHLKLVWGGLVFRGRAVEVGITYKLFNPDGHPIRALVRVRFKGSIEERKRVAREDSRSPDITHERTVGPRDTLPLMCHRVYGDPRHYLLVAEHNGLDDFRRLTVGQSLLFPPLPDREVTR